MAYHGKTMKPLIILFFVSLLLGQLGGVSLWPGVVVYVHDIILVLLLVFSLKKVRRVKLTVPIALFLVSCLLSLVANISRFPLPALLTGSLYLVRWTLYAMLYVLVLQDYVYTNIWLNGLYIVGIGFGLLGLMQFLLYPDLRNLMYLGWDPHYYRLFSTLLDPNFMGIILVFTLLLGFGLLTKKNRVWIIAGQVAAFIALLLTYSRSSFLALGAAIIVWAIIRKQWEIFCVLIALTGIILVLPKIPGDTLKLTRADSSLARVGNWQESLILITKAPFFGYGFDTLRYVRPVDVVSKAAAGVDSSILFILATTGIVGFAAYVYLLASMIRIGKEFPYYSASISAILVHSLFVNSMFYPWVMIWIWILSGVVGINAKIPFRRHKPKPFRLYCYL